MVTIHDNGTAEFAVFAPHASAVDIVGGFTNWQEQPVRMTRATDGWWSATIELKPGDHEFQYRVNDREWIPDYAAGGIKRSPFGTWVSLLHIPGGKTLPAPALRRAA